MTIKKQKSAQQNQQNLSIEEKDTVLSMFAADELLEAVMSMLNIDQSDEIFKKLMYNTLRRQTKDFIIYTIWNHLTPTQAKELQKFMDFNLDTYPWMNHEDVLIEFSLLYPEFTPLINDSLSDFFKSFVFEFNKINKA